jgi:hypothetical protein
MQHLRIAVTVLLVATTALNTSPASATEPATLTAAEAFKQVQQAAAAGEGGQMLANGVTAYDSAPFYLHVRSYGSGYCLDNFASGGGQNNSPVGFWQCNGGPTLLWRWRIFDSSHFYGTELVSNYSGRCLDYPASAGGQIGYQINVYDCHDGGWSGQNFHVHIVGSDLWLSSEHTPWFVCLDGYADWWQGNGSPAGLGLCNTANPNVYQRWF